MFFTKKADENKMREFWDWFVQNEKWIIDTYQTDGMAVVEAVDEKLSPAFSCYKRDIEFMLGENDGKGEFIFFDLHSRSLRKDGEILASLMPKQLKEKWTFIIEH